MSVVLMIQAVLPGMRERRSGAIVNVSSIAGRLAIAGHGHYSAVKHALEAMSEALAQEVIAFGIRVASQPIDVARVIHEAATASAPKVRWPVGKDAELLIAGRGRLSDEDYVATGQDMTDDEYLDLMRRRYGFEW